MATHYIGADVHSKITEVAVVNRRGQEAGRYRVPTTIPALVDLLKTIGGDRVLAIEEGPMADWLHRHLASRVEEFVVSDPRHNRWIAAPGEKNDALDALKLAQLARGKYLKPVYHGSDRQLTELKRWVALYGQAVRQAVRAVTQIRSACRMEGLAPRRRVLRDAAARMEWLDEKVPAGLAARLEVMALGYDAAATQVAEARRQLQRRGRRYPIVRLWQTLPGVGLIRAVTALAYLETPWRFRCKSALWRYCGLGLERRTSGTDRHGGAKAGTLRLARDGNRRLKNVFMGAAISAIRQGHNRFAANYERMLSEGIAPANARRTVARQGLTVMWGMWKSGQADLADTTVTPAVP